MARKIGKLAPSAVQKTTKPGRYADGGGLYLVVTRGGTRSWAFRFTVAGRAHEMGLGPAHTVGLADAREKARQCRRQLLDGTDPLAQRREAKAPPVASLTFGEVAELYLAAHAPGWRSVVHERQWRNSLRDHVLPTLGGMSVAAIDTGAVMRVLEPIWASKPETASRARQRMESILDYAAARGWRNGDNPARWKGHLANLLPAPGRVKPLVHHPAMRWQDVPAFVASLASRQGMAARALLYTVLTAARSGEARGATWGELDLANAIWTLPGARMKAGQAHRVPLSAAVLALLPRHPEEAQPDTLVFPGGKDGNPLSDVALSRLLPPGVTVHGFRSTFRDWAGETTQHPREVVEMALAHRLGDAVEQAYARGDLFKKRRALMDTWAEYCLNCKAEHSSTE